MSGLPLPWSAWRHVVKLDPDRSLRDADLRELAQIGTDAVLVGGTQGITFEKTAALIRRLRKFAPGMEIWQEVSEQTAVVPDADGYGIPVVLNAGSTEWLIGRHKAAIERFGDLIPWRRVVAEGYVILNPDAAAAKLTRAEIPRSARETAAYAVAAERILGIKLIYLEYSGRYGEPEWVRQVRGMTSAHLVYGGGIDSGERAAEMAAIADTIVVGNALYEKGMETVKETVEAVRRIKG